MRRREAIFSLTAVAGLAIAGGLVIAHDAPRIVSAVAGQGLGLVAVLAFHLIPLAVGAAAWQPLVHPAPKGGFSLFLWARTLREAVNDLLPVAQIGGTLAGTRSLILSGAPVIPAAAAAIVDQTAETFGQFVFTAIGLALFASDGRAPDLVAWLAKGLALSAPFLIALILAQRAGLIRLGEQALAPLLRSLSARDYAPGDLHEAVDGIYRRLAPLALGFVLHLAAWCIGAIEVWLILHFMGQEVSLETAFILESLGQAVRSAAFLVPAGLGIQEGGYLILGTALGLSPEASLALSLTKRLRELTIGGMVLVAWQWSTFTRVRAPARGGG